MQRRRTRIVATLGPATDHPGVLEQMLDAGVDVVRLNFSHGTADEHISRVVRLRELAKDRPRPVAILADLPGPKLRVLLPQPLTLNPGDEITFATEPGDSEIGVTEPECLTDTRPGHRVLLDDGRLQCRVVRSEERRCMAIVEVGGLLQPNKGVNLPDTPLSIPAVTERDRAALEVAAQVGADWLALSFVRGPEAASEVRAAAAELGLEVPVLAKIERPEAVRQAVAIVAAFNGVMVARGDLGVEIPLEQVPGVQKMLIREARAAGKPVVTATDMLDSMRTNPRPTRAEASDVANAIFDGTDAVMLSGETAIGAYPVEAVRTMARIAREAESFAPYAVTDGSVVPADPDTPVTMAVCTLAEQVRAAAIVVPTLSGRTARLIARCRPACTIVAPVPSEAIRRRLALVWGVVPVPLAADLPPGSDRLGAAVRAAFDAGAVLAGQEVIVLAGHPVQGGERMPTVRLVRVVAGGASAQP